MIGVQCKHIVAEVFRQQIMLSYSSGLTLQLRCGNVEVLERKLFMNGLSVCDLYQTPKPEVTRNVKKKMIWNEENPMDEQSFVEFMKTCSNRIAPSLRRVALVEYPMQTVLMNLACSFRWWLTKNSRRVAGHLLVKRTAAKEATCVWNETKTSVQNLCTVDRDIGTEETRVARREIKSLYLRMSLL